MRIYFCITFAVLLSGCQHPQSSDETVRISRSLERRITVQEARHLLLHDIEQAIRAAGIHASASQDARTELDNLTKRRQVLDTHLDSFLARSLPNDELWSYRTSITASQRGGESGFALVRNGRVVEHMGVITYD